LIEESELEIPDDRHRSEVRVDQEGDADDARLHDVDVGDPAPTPERCAQRRAEAGAEDHQEHERLRERRDDATAVAPVAEGVAVSPRTGRGTNALPSGTCVRRLPLSRVAGTPNSVLISRAASSGCVEVIVTTSPPTICFSSSGVPRATILPRSMIAIRSQYSASSM